MREVAFSALVAAGILMVAMTIKVVFENVADGMKAGSKAVNVPAIELRGKDGKSIAKTGD